MFRRQAAISLSRRGYAYSPRSVNIAREPNDYELSVRQVVVSTITVSTQRFPVVQSFITVATHERNFVIGVQTRVSRYPIVPRGVTLPLHSDLAVSLRADRPPG